MNVGATIEPSPWLLSEDGNKGMPYYLWDVKRKRTVVVHRLREKPKYVAVSHTWGRWCKGASDFVKGVPWKVPQNTKFEVHNLPAILAAVPLGFSYIWLDYVCIPQNRSRQAIIEISRQATIFREASKVLH